MDHAEDSLELNLGEIMALEGGDTGGTGNLVQPGLLVIATTISICSSLETQLTIQNAAGESSQSLVTDCEGPSIGKGLSTQ